MQDAHEMIHHVPDDLLEAIDYCYEQGWTDGLPVVPPEENRVDTMCLMEGRPRETVLAHHPATNLELTIHALAVCVCGGGEGGNIALKLLRVGMV